MMGPGIMNFEGTGPREECVFMGDKNIFCQKHTAVSSLQSLAPAVYILIIKAGAVINMTVGINLH